MTFLADVNVLLALAWAHNSGHARARTWLDGLSPDDSLATCAISELGFVRISLQTVPGVDVNQLKKTMAKLRSVSLAGHSWSRAQWPRCWTSCAAFPTTIL